MEKSSSWKRMAPVALGALGVVYGDIGTSPLYTFKECFHGSHHIAATRENIFGVLSLIVWSLILLVSVKYLALVLRADSKGEGGILSLMSLAFPEKGSAKYSQLFIIIGLFGAALLYGDGMITPAITVLSAVEGLEVVTTEFKPYIIPITVLVLAGLFSFQRYGSGKVGNIFGPLTLLWFLAIAAVGLGNLVQSPEILLSVNPVYAVRFFINNGFQAFVVMGSVFLAVTGAEALYADLGHFGRGPIRLAWFTVVFPALLLNYFGQGAFLIQHPEGVSNPFYRMTPGWALYPMVFLATAAAVIASQALITGVFSLTMQAIQLGYCPRLRVEHTSSQARGQIYLPQINWTLMVACIGLVIGFRASTNLAAAYGIAITLTMMITTILFYFAARRLWNWNRWAALGICIPFFLLELAFFSANTLKIAHGGWFPFAVGLFIFTLMATWKTGRKLLGKRLQASALPLETFLNEMDQAKPQRVAGTAVFLASNPQGAPLSLLHNLKHNKVLHDKIVLLTIQSDEAPYLPEEGRITVERLRPNFFRVVGRFGFMETADIPQLLAGAKEIELEMMKTTFFLSRETIIPTANPGMALWREHLFTIMSRNAQTATAFFHLPANRVVELGMQVEM